MTQAPPLVVVLAGPNGAGKTTTAPSLLRDALAVGAFVNADPIAAGLSGLDPASVEMAAGRVMLRRLRELAAAHASFSFETTLASRSFAPWLARLRSDGYRVHVAFLSLPTADLAVARVAERVRQGGHSVPEDVVRRRFVAGLRNLLGLYRHCVDTWQVHDNAAPGGPILIASGTENATSVHDAARWDPLVRAVR